MNQSFTRSRSGYVRDHLSFPAPEEQDASVLLDLRTSFLAAQTSPTKSNAPPPSADPSPGSPRSRPPALLSLAPSDAAAAASRRSLLCNTSVQQRAARAGDRPAASAGAGGGGDEPLPPPSPPPDDLLLDRLPQIRAQASPRASFKGQSQPFSSGSLLDAQAARFAGTSVSSASGVEWTLPAVGAGAGPGGIQRSGNSFHQRKGSSPLAHQPNSSPLACGGAAVEGSGSSSFNYAGTRSINQSRAPRKRASNLFAVAVRGGGPGGLQEENGEDDDLAEMKQVQKSGRSFCASDLQQLRQVAAQKAAGISPVKPETSADSSLLKMMLGGIGIGSGKAPDAQASAGKKEKAGSGAVGSKKSWELEGGGGGGDGGELEAARRLGPKGTSLLGADQSTHIMRSLARLNCRW